MQENYVKNGMILGQNSFRINILRLKLNCRKNRNRSHDLRCSLTWKPVGNQALNTFKSECQKAGVPAITEIVIGSVPESIQQKADQCMLVVIAARAGSSKRF